MSYTDQDGKHVWKPPEPGDEGKFTFEKEHHMACYHMDRFCYHLARDQARQPEFASSVGSIILDGSSGVDYPYRKEGSKVSKAERKARVHLQVTAVLRHLPSDDPQKLKSEKRIYLSYSNMYSHDANHTTSILARLFTEMLNEKDKDGKPHGIPRVFHIRTDSGTRLSDLACIPFKQLTWRIASAIQAANRKTGEHLASLLR
jgi:hypothetical protein